MLRSLLARARARLFSRFVPLAKAGAPPGRLKDISVKRIALCRRGRNGLRTLLKADGSLSVETLCKADKATIEATGELLTVIYAPERPDADGHIASAEEIKKACYRFGQNGAREVDLEHDGQPLSLKDVYPAETFIVQKSDERFHNWQTYDGQPAGDLTGAWATVYQIENPALRAAYARGEWDGVSLFGHGAVEPLEKAQQPPAPENEMNEAQLKALFAEFKTGLIAEVTTLVKAAEPKSEPKQEPAKETPAPAVGFEGDIDNPDDLAKLEKSIRTQELNALLKSGKLTSAKLAEMRKAIEGGGDEDEDEGDEECADRPSSNAPPAKPRPGKLSKADLAKAAMDEGDAIAKIYNEQSSSVNDGGFRIVSR